MKHRDYSRKMKQLRYKPRGYLRNGKNMNVSEAEWAWGEVVTGKAWGGVPGATAWKTL